MKFMNFASTITDNEYNGKVSDFHEIRNCMGIQHAYRIDASDRIFSRSE